MLRAGGDAWIPGSYDPATNLIFWGTAQAKPWARFARGTDGDALFTNCTLAIDPRQEDRLALSAHSRGDARSRRSVRAHPDRCWRPAVRVLDGQLGILWELDRKTGAFLAHTICGTRTSSTST